MLPKVCVVLVVAPLVLASHAHADRAEPVPLYGHYDTYLDHSRQTFNGTPDPSGPSMQEAMFTTDCGGGGCTAHWFRLTDLQDNPNAPAQFDYRWNVDRWESSGDYPFHCGANGTATVTAYRSDFLKPNGDGSFAGERMFTVKGEGCQGQGAGTYWLPFTLTPK